MKKHSFMNTVVFPNHKKALYDLYQPLNIRSKALSKAKRVVDYPDRLIDQYPRLLLTDTAGMGKSTLLKFMFLKCIEQNARIPVFVELRRLSKTVKLIDAIFEELNPLDETFDGCEQDCGGLVLMEPTFVHLARDWRTSSWPIVRYARWYVATGGGAVAELTVRVESPAKRRRAHEAA